MSFSPSKLCLYDHLLSTPKEPILQWFGKKESFLQKAIKTRSIFGTRFFLHYATRFVRAKLNPAKSVLKVLERHGLERIELTESINSRASLKRMGDLHPDLLISIAGALALFVSLLQAKELPREVVER